MQANAVEQKRMRTDFLLLKKFNFPRLVCLKIIAQMIPQKFVTQYYTKHYNYIQRSNNAEELWEMLTQFSIKGELSAIEKMRDLAHDTYTLKTDGQKYFDLQYSTDDKERV